MLLVCLYFCLVSCLKNVSYFCSVKVTFIVMFLCFSFVCIFVLSAENVSYFCSVKVTFIVMFLCCSFVCIFVLSAV